MNIPSSALFIQLRRIGDILMCTPAVRAFKERYPSCQLDFLSEWPDVLRGNPNIGEIIPVDPARQYHPLYQWQLINDIRKRKYDVVVDFLANPRSAYYSFLSGAPKRLSYGYGHRKWAYNIIPPKPEKNQYAALDKLQLLESLEVFSNNVRLEFYPNEKNREESRRLLGKYAGKPLISISPVSRRHFRRWPLEKFAMLGNLLVNSLNINVAIICGPGEREIADKVAMMMEESNPLILEISDINLLGAIFENMILHIGNDNGPKHIAVACGAPTISIYGPHNPISWTYPDSSRHLWISPEIICDDCNSRKNKCGDKCISDISVEAVWEKAQGLVNSFKLNSPQVKRP